MVRNVQGPLHMSTLHGNCCRWSMCCVIAWFHVRLQQQILQELCCVSQTSIWQMWVCHLQFEVFNALGLTDLRPSLGVMVV